MSGDLASRPVLRRLMPQCDAANSERGADGSANAGGQMRIVVAADPVPPAALLQTRQHCEVVFGKALGQIAAMKTVAKCDDARRLNRANHLVQSLKCGARVVRGKQHAKRGEDRALLEMKIGDEERVLRFPIERAGGKRPHLVVRDENMRTQ